MSFLEVIEPFNKRLDTYQKLRTFSGIQPRDLRLLADIFLEYVANPKGDMVPTLGCSPCVAKMFQRLVTHREQERQKNVDFINSVLQQSEETITISSGEVEVPIEVYNQVSHFYTTEELVDKAVDISIENLPWGKFKKYCTTKGIKVKGKTRKQLLKELGFND